MTQNREPFDPRGFLTRPGAGRAVVEVRKNHTVYAQGDAADTVFYIQRGRIKATVLSAQGKEAVMAILEPGHFFGEGCLDGATRRFATIVALEDTLVTSISREAMLSTLRDQPALSELFMNYLIRRKSRIEEDLVDQLFNSSDKRLARLLLLLARSDASGGMQEIVPSLSQETLAEMIGTTRSRVSFFMNRFRKLGMINYNGKIEVDVALLKSFLRDNPQIGSLLDSD